MMKSIGLVLEGGGMRGAYTAGVLAAFTDNNIDFPYVIGVSAGANNGADFISRQMDRNRRVFIDHVAKKEYCGVKYLVREKSYFNMKFLFETLIDEVDPFDYDTFINSKTMFKAVATDASTGQAVYFSKEQFKEKGKEFFVQVLKASSSLPLISPPVEIEGKLYYDGGVSDSIPIDQSIRDGNVLNVVVLTRNEGYRKKEQKLGAVSKKVLSKYPKVYEAIKNRHIKYNVTLEKIERLEREGYVYVFRPIEKLKVHRIEKDIEKLEELYQQGYNETVERMEDFLKWLNANS